jgi:hypothetical protein
MLVNNFDQEILLIRLKRAQTRFVLGGSLDIPSVQARKYSNNFAYSKSSPNDNPFSDHGSERLSQRALAFPRKRLTPKRTIIARLTRFDTATVNYRNPLNLII